MSFVHRLIWFVKNQLGINPILFVRGLIRLPGFFFNYYQFKKKYLGKIILYPCLHDSQASADSGASETEYFTQDLWVARQIFENKPEKHLDVGSRIDGFVAHVASFRDIDVCDIRPQSKKVEHIHFKQKDFSVNLDDGWIERYDSVSCLHALEHFGLGRYGDELALEAYKVCLKNLSLSLKENGLCYLSTPVGIARIEFNAHRVFDPVDLVNLAQSYALKPLKILMIDSSGNILNDHVQVQSLAEWSDKAYSLGVFVFRKEVDA
jgi:hypothetical protein